MPDRRPPAEVRVDLGTVRQLLVEQHPELADRPLQPVDEGWDNFVFRLGSDLAVRLPRRRIAVELLRNEQRWLPVLARRLPVAVSEPVACGGPGPGYPWPWSIVRWIAGEPYGTRSPGHAAVGRFADFLRALHRPAPSAAPREGLRGRPLTHRRDTVAERLRGLGLERLLPAWHLSLRHPASERSTWIHGDLHGRNVLHRSGELAGIIDWGDLTAGDPATDLAVGWLLFATDAERSELFRAYGASRAVVARARGWAVAIGAALVASREPRHEALGRVVVDRVLSAGHEPGPVSA